MIEPADASARGKGPPARAASAQCRARTGIPASRSKLRSRSGFRDDVRCKEQRMKGWMAIATGVLWLSVGAPALAQSSPPPLPTLTPQQSSEVEQRLDPYRRQTEDRVARGEITADEADRLLQWREWQIARNVADVHAAPPPDYGAPPDYAEAPPDYDARAPQVVIVQPPRYYVPSYPYPYPYPAPYYWGPRPYYYGPSICAGGFGHHFGGRVCF
jgi:hypothetical protein